MQHIETSQRTALAIKRAAKLLSRETNTPHTQYLDTEARRAGYLHWHHVSLCVAKTESLARAEPMIRVVSGVSGTGKTQTLYRTILAEYKLGVRPIVLSRNEPQTGFHDVISSIGGCTVINGIEPGPDIPLFIDVSQTTAIDWMFIPRWLKDGRHSLVIDELDSVCILVPEIYSLVNLAIQIGCTVTLSSQNIKSVEQRIGDLRAIKFSGQEIQYNVTELF